MGSGGMGVVYEALRDHPRQTVAIKLLKHGIGSETQRQRFNRESEFLATLHHPHIAQLYDVGMLSVGSETMPYFVMELVESGKPITVHALEKKLSIREKIELFLFVCDAVQHGHDKGILHRDLKPENILVDAQGQVKIIDFGVARALGEDADAKRYTSTGQFVGTVQYMSPEQVQGHSAKLDERSDVYSLGVVLYELLTGRLPYIFSGNSIVEAARTIRDTAPTRPSRYLNALKGDLDSILIKTLSKRRDIRYESAQELKRELERYLDNQPLATRHTGSLYLVRHSADRFMLRHPFAAAVVTVLVASLIAELFAVPLVYQWTPLHRMYQSSLAGLIPLETSVQAMEHVRVVRMTDQTVEDIQALTEKLGATEVDANDWKSMRVMHGHFMKRLADVGVRVLAWDMNFIGDSPYNAQFLEGLKAMEAAGTPVVIGVPTWALDEEGYPLMAREFVPYSRWGCATTFFDTEGPWEVELLLHNTNGMTLHSFDLNIAASWWHPEWRSACVFDPNEFPVVRMDFFQPVEGSETLRKPLGKTRRLTLTSNWIVDEQSGDEQYGIFENDFLGYYSFSLPTDESLNSSTYSYEWVFRASPEELRDALRGKVVMVGDMRTPVPDGKNDFYQTPDRRTLHGAFGHAAAIEALLNGSVILDERLWTSRLGIGLLAAIGLLIAWLGAARPARRVAIHIVLAGVLIVTAYVLYSGAHYVFNPIVPFIAAVLAGEIGVRIIRLRRSYFA